MCIYMHHLQNRTLPCRHAEVNTLGLSAIDAVAHAPTPHITPASEMHGDLCRTPNRRQSLRCTETCAGHQIVDKASDVWKPVQDIKLSTKPRMYGDLRRTPNRRQSLGPAPDVRRPAQDTKSLTRRQSCFRCAETCAGHQIVDKALVL